MHILYGPPGDATGSEFVKKSVIRTSFEQNARTLYLVPSHRKRQHFLESFGLAGGGVPPILLTFNEFAGDLARRVGWSKVLCTPKFAGIWKQFVLTDIARRILADILPVTVGLVQDAVRHITELKQAGLGPDDLAAVPDASDGFGGALIELYRAYETHLETHHLTDPEGLLLDAVTILDEWDESVAFPWTRVIADGFLEFTEPQLRILNGLSNRLDTTVIWPGLPGADTIFTHFEATLRLAFPDSTWEPLSSDSVESGSELVHLARQFAGAGVSGSLATGNLRYMPCESILKEVESIVRDIRGRLKDAETHGSDLKPGDICVTFPDLMEYGPLVRRIFRRYGIPVNISQALPLTSSSLFSTISAVLAAPPVYHRSALMALFRDPLVEPPGFDQSSLTISWVDRLTRELKTLNGPDKWRQRIRHEMQKTGDSVRGEMRRKMLAGFLDILESLFRILDTLNEPRPFPDFFDALIQVLEKLGLRKRLKQLADTRQAMPVDHDRTHEYAIRAYASFLEFRDEFRRMRSPEFLTGILTLDEFRAILPRVLQDISYQLTTMAEDRVQVLGRLENRGLTFRHVYLGGLTDQAFPSPEQPSSFWPPQLRSLLLDLPADNAHTQAMADMYRILLTPMETLTLSRPLKQNDEDLLPGQIWIQLSEIVSDKSLYQPPVEPVSIGEDLAVRGTNLQTQSPDKWPREPGYDNLVLAALAFGEHTRGELWQHGQIRWDVLVALVTAQFKDGRIISVSRLERCVQCPRRFFYETVLKLEVPEDPAEELDNMELGTLIHETLHDFYSERIRAGSGKISPEEIESAADRIRQIATDLFEQQGLQGVFARRDLDGITGVGSAGGIARAFAETESKFPETLVPTRLEWSFGMREDNPGLSITVPGESPVVIRGKIDRMDTAGNEVIVMDYKSGSPPDKKDVLALKYIQVGIYMLALKTLENLNVTTGCYYSVSPRKGVSIAPVLWSSDSRVQLKQRIKPQPAEAYEAYFDELKLVAAETISEIRRGFFPAKPDKKICGYCIFPNLCRVPAGDDDDE